MALTFNVSKTKFMKLNNKRTKKWRNNLIQTFYTYLGVLITNKCEEEKKVEFKLAKSNKLAENLK